MTFLDDAPCPDGRSQHFTFFRRELLQRLATATLLHLASQYRPALRLPAKYPVPEFHIGDKVADHWTDEFGEDAIEIGEILGVCWHPDENTWAYLISWTSGSCNADCYPCFDERLVVGGDVRLAHV